MFRNVLVPLDGSARAEAALPVAARLARVSGGSIILVRVVTTSLEYWPAVATAPQMSVAQTVADSDLEEAERYLAQLTVTEMLRDIPTETVVLFGSAAPTILAVAYSYNADIIVMCSHGYTGMKRWVMGSVAEKIARHSSIPVLILRDGSPLPMHPYSDTAQSLRAVVTLDGSSNAKATLQPAAMLVAALSSAAKGELCLLRVVRTTPGMSSEERQQMLRRAQSYLQTTIADIQAGLIAAAVTNFKLAVSGLVLSESDVAETILKVAEGTESENVGQADLIVMATHGRSGLQHWAMGSITERVINATHLPILIVRPSEMVTSSHNQQHAVYTLNV